MNEEEYLEFERTHAGKHEFVNGHLVAMSGVSDAHDLVVGNLHFALRRRLQGGPCRPRTSDLRIRIDETGLYAYPDLSVVCGAPEFAPTRPETLLNPSVVVEVLSGTTEDYDRGAKANHYRRRPSITSILLVDSQTRRVTSLNRRPDGSWSLVDHDGGDVPIAALGLSVSLDEIYEDTAEAMSRAAPAERR